MIHESYFWKKELYNSFLTIIKFRHSGVLNEQSQVDVEKALMIGAYIIRKLNEAQKIPPDFLFRKEILEFSQSTGTIVDHFNWHKIDLHYNLGKVGKVEKDWVFITNQIIHSFSLLFSNDSSGKLDGFLFNSDTSKKKGLFFISLEIMLTMFLAISEGEITEAHSYRQILKDEHDGKQKLGEMKLLRAVYSYPDDFDIKEIIMKSLGGDIYERKTE